MTTPAGRYRGTDVDAALDRGRNRREQANSSSSRSRSSSPVNEGWSEEQIANTAKMVSVAAKVAFVAFAVGIILALILMPPLAAIGATIGFAVGAYISYEATMVANNVAKIHGGGVNASSALNAFSAAFSGKPSIPAYTEHAPISRWVWTFVKSGSEE